MKTLAHPHDKAEILERLSRLRADRERRWGRMSAHQMTCHLCDAFRMATGKKSVSPATGLWQRTVVKWMALYAPLPWPSGILTRPEIDQAQDGTRPVDFAEDLRQLEALVELVTAGRRGIPWPAHPIFGRMSEADWLRWSYLHMDHHLRQFGV